MSSKNLSLEQLLDLIELEDYRGIINKDEVLETVVKRGALPKFINDIRGILRLTIEREGEGFSVTQHNTDHVEETINEIYPIANTKPASDNSSLDLPA
jgi:hypothetical protein